MNYCPFPIFKSWVTRITFSFFLRFLISKQGQTLYITWYRAWIQSNSQKWFNLQVSVGAEFSNGNTDKLISFPIPEFGSLSLKENYALEENTKENDYFSFSSFKDSSRSWSSTTESSEEIQAWMNSTLKPKKKQHKRKGVPRRAPLG